MAVADTRARVRPSLARAVAEPPRWAAAVGVAALALAVWLVYGAGYVEYDPGHSLVWGRDLAEGRLPPDFESRLSPTPHPLPIAAAALLAPLGAGAATAAVGLFAPVAVAAAGWAAFRLGTLTVSAAAGAILAALLLTRTDVIRHALAVSVDIPFLALVLWAAALEVARPRRGEAVLATLAVAGLLRPEAWLFALAYLLWVVAGSPRPAAGRVLRLAALAFAAPVAWTTLDLVVTGDPLHSLHATSFGAERLSRPRGLGEALRLGPSYLYDLLGPAVLAGAVAATARTTRAARARFALPAAIAGLGVLAFLALGVAGLALLPRYLFVPATMIALACAAAVAGGGAEPRRRGPALALAVVLAAGLVVQLAVRDGPELRRLAERGDRRVAEDRALSSLLASGAAGAVLADCRPLQVHNYRLLPLLAYHLDRRPGEIVIAEVEAARTGALLAPARGPRPPAAMQEVARNTAWVAYASCPAPATLAR